MKLYDEGKFGLTDKASQYLPFLQGTNKSRITIQDLLFHESGLPAYWPFYEEVIDTKSCKGGLFTNVRMLRIPYRWLPIYMLVPILS